MKLAKYQCGFAKQIFTAKDKSINLPKINILQNADYRNKH
jgi:glutaredoxin-related protein